MLYFTSDWHLGHSNIIKYCNRPFRSVDEMNDSIIDNMNSVATKDDTIVVVGDICMGNISHTLPLLAFIDAELFLVPGNHDRVHPMNNEKTLRRYLPEYDRYIKILNTSVASWGDFNVCHFPYNGDSHDSDRFDEWRLKNRNIPLVCGHVHEKWKIQGNQINVGVDVWDFMPVSIDVIDEIVKEMQDV